MAGKAVDFLIFEEQRFRDRPEGLFDPAGELDDHHRVDAVILHRRQRVDIDRGQPGAFGDDALQEFDRRPTRRVGIDGIDGSGRCPQ